MIATESYGLFSKWHVKTHEAYANTFMIFT